ncbi:MAG: hypothetical protein K6T90_11045 [Leptolyngbyaceae cyanobacterium HOT.MB2.61]|jgi:hypothetical protein|nr:hypothetical protein [Leptolyngbyaceae cyanobacterium HOT.MB2.61]
MEKPIYLPETECIPNLPKQDWVGLVRLSYVARLIENPLVRNSDASGKILFDREFL